MTRQVSVAVAVFVGVAMSASAASGGLPLRWRSANAPVPVVRSTATPVVTTYSSRSAFVADAPGALTLEDFENGKVAAGATQGCGSYEVASTMQDSCFNFGGIVSGLRFSAFDLVNGPPADLSIFGGGAYGNSSIALGSTVGDAGIVIEPSGVPMDAVGLDLFTATTNETATVILFGVDMVQFASYDVPVTPAGQFFGVKASAPIGAVIVYTASGAVELIDDVEVALFDADLDLVASKQSALPSVTYTFTPTNHGPRAATGVTVTNYLATNTLVGSDDCGGVASGSAWTWSVGSLAVGGSATCHLTVTVAAPGVAYSSTTVTGDQGDSVPGNNTKSAVFETFADGQDTLDPSFALFRSFPDVTIPDETGTPFRFRDHADQLLILQFCGAWCSPCQLWTSETPALQQALADAIGAENFLLVDLLYEDGDHAPSDQVDAAQWKAQRHFPGPVLHAEGSAGSALSQLVNQLASGYWLAGQTFGIPYFVILAPDCDNQIALRGLSVISLGEEVALNLSDTTHVAQLATGIWNENRCAKPLVHRLDRCSVGSAPVRLSGPSALEAADSFVVPAGPGFDVDAANVVVESSDALSFYVALRADSGGKPSDAVCTGFPVSSEAVNGSYVRRIAFTPRCHLPPGTYWLETLPIDPANPIYPLWRGGVLPSNGPYALKDASNQLGLGCTGGWMFAGQCYTSDPTANSVELCYDLETANPKLFGDGFEVGSDRRWRGDFP